MGNKREQRIRRKARAGLRAMQRNLDAASSWRPIALAAISYVDEIDAPNPHEPWSIANRRDVLRDVVHAHRGGPVRGSRREPQAVRSGSLPNPSPQNEARVWTPRRALSAPMRAVPTPRPPVPPVDIDQLSRDLEVKRVELRNAAKRYGAEANKRRRDMNRVAELGAALDAASKAFAAAEARINHARRAA